MTLSGMICEGADIEAAEQAVAIGCDFGDRRVVRRGKRRWAPGSLVAKSAAMRCAFALVTQVADTPATVLLRGETGTGKEVLAQAIHDGSARRARPMITVNCAAIPPTLVESELFGRERGAYTDAQSRRIGRFEAAHRSTIFLDEIGDLPLDAQVKLLRAIQERTIQRLGGTESIKIDVRIIAATNRNLEAAIEAGSFREDLFYRLNVFPITVPPLRERLDDLAPLTWAFVDEFSLTFDKPIEAIATDSLAAMRRYTWPGNIRELRNVVEREMIVAHGPTLSIAIPRMTSSLRSGSVKLRDVEADHIRAVLAQCQWRVRGVDGAAERLGLKPTTLESRMMRLGIRNEHRWRGRGPGLGAR